MRTLTPHLVTGAIASIGLLGSANAAFVVEPNGLAALNFSAVNATGNSTTAGSGTLLAPGLTFGAPSVFGGEPYTYSYTPANDSDNITTWSSGTVLNSGAGINSTGLIGGGAGYYNVYHVFPQTTNATGQPTLFDVQLNGLSAGVTMVMTSQDENVANLATGAGVGLWELVAQVAVTNPAETITVDLAPGTAPTFTGIRTAGVLFEYTGPIPEPSSSVLLGLGALALLRRRR